MLSRFANALACAGALVFASSARAALATETPVGYMHLSLPGDTASRGTPSGMLGVVVWYPAPSHTVMQPLVVGPPDTPLFAEGDASPDAPIAPASARVPLIVVSHGTGGTAMDLSWLCAALAARGYIVASVDHPGNNALEAPTVAGATLWWLRADDLSRAIDGLLHNPNFETRIDPARIGAAGFSLGGYTVLAIAGATGPTRSAWNRTAREIRRLRSARTNRRPRFQGCAPVRASSRLTTRCIARHSRATRSRIAIRG